MRSQESRFIHLILYEYFSVPMGCRWADRSKPPATAPVAVDTAASMKRAWSSSGIPGQPRLHLVERQLRQDRDPVEALLAVDCDVVAESLERLARKRLVDAFRFLQADDVGLAFASAKRPHCPPVA